MRDSEGWGWRGWVFLCTVEVLTKLKCVSSGWWMCLQQGCVCRETLWSPSWPIHPFLTRSLSLPLPPGQAGSQGPTP